MVNCLNPICILIIILGIFLICSLLSVDHFSSINQLNCKYNSKNIYEFEKPSEKTLSMQDKINQELSSHPLTLNNNSSNQYYNYNDDQNILSNKKLNNSFGRQYGIGSHTATMSDKQIFNDVISNK